MAKYKVVGGGSCYGVAHLSGGLEYDNLDTKAEATRICAVLNRGIGPERDAVEAELDAEDRRRSQTIENRYHPH